MRPALALALLLLPLPAVAQEADGGLGDVIEDGARAMIEGLIENMRPAIDDLEGLVAEYGPLLGLLGEEMGPALLAVFSQIDSIGHYQAPEILPNGDIIMRRNPDAPDWVPPEDRPEAEAPAPVKPGVVDI